MNSCFSYSRYCVVFAALILCGAISPAQAATWYVATNGDDVATGTNWPTAKRTIQAAVDTASAGDTVQVAEGLYNYGGRAAPGELLSNIVLIDKALTVESVSGPTMTTIRGISTVRCVRMVNGAELTGFTLREGGTLETISNADPDGNGAGVYADSTQATITHCILTENTATQLGGGGAKGTFNSCLIIGNQAKRGGGLYDGLLRNCTVSDNVATESGRPGGILTGSGLNSVVYGNRDGTGAEVNFSAFSTFENSCTSPHPGGLYNITDDPLFVGVGDYRLGGTSPCINQGSNDYVTVFTDLSGDPRIQNGSVDMGSYELGTYENYPTADITVNAVGGSGIGSGTFPVTSPVQISATPANSHSVFVQWNDGNTNLTRSVVVPHVDISYTATFTESIVGVITSYVSEVSSNPVHPFTSWATAATNIQDAVDMTLDGDVVLVGDGVYRHGGRPQIPGLDGTNLLNRVMIDKAITVRSVNGPATTFIEGSGGVGPEIRGVYIDSDTSFSGFTVTNGISSSRGGGLYLYGSGLMISNCVVTGNQGGDGGGIFVRSSDVLIHSCILSGNETSDDGGGIYVYAYDGASNITIQASTISDNSGAGVFGNSTATNVILQTCTISGNSRRGVERVTVFNSLITGNAGGAFAAHLYGCTLSGNTTSRGGGASSGSLTDCIISGNQATDWGGGTYSSTLTDCTLTANSATNFGGGAFGGNLTDCILTDNHAGLDGGGAEDATLVNCVLSGNTADRSGGGASNGGLTNCLLFANHAQEYGGGGKDVSLNNCTVSGNSAGISGGGMHNGSANNSIVYFNTNTTGAVDNYQGGSMTYSCSTPLPYGAGNVEADPLFVDRLTHNFHLASLSPCINAGDNASAPAGAGLDGNPRILAGVVDMGPYEADVVAVSVVVVNGNPVGDGYHHQGSNAVLSATPGSPHAVFAGWTDGESNLVRSIVVPQTNITYTATYVLDMIPLTTHVDVDSTNPVWPFSSWATAATNIQDAVDILLDGDTVLVEDGVYEVGGRALPGQILTNRVIIDKAIAVRSVNGPDVTIIRGAIDPATTNGYAAVRGVWMAANAALHGFTVTQGATGSTSGTGEELGGGGIHADSSTAIISNCVITANTAFYRGGGATGGTYVDCAFRNNETLFGYGGGVSSAANGETPFLVRCLLRGNHARYDGGGASFVALDNCLLLENSAGQDGGGATGSAMTNCTVVANSAVRNGGGIYGQSSRAIIRNSIIYFNTSDTMTTSNRHAGDITYSCVGGEGTFDHNIELDPQFVDLASRNLRLLPSSPCRNIGLNSAVVSGSTDLDGNPRIFNFNVDIGAYESLDASAIVYVDIANATPVYPYTSWATAATNIQDGVAAATLDATVRVADGVYQTGSRIYPPAQANRVYIDKRVYVTSVNGPASTFIVGDAAGDIRCVGMVEGSWLSGFTLSNGVAQVGGGVYVPAGGYLPTVQATVSNCVVTSNHSSGGGGGAYGGTLIDCTFTANSAIDGGGAHRATLITCTLDGNSATGAGGGACESTLTDSHLMNNTASGRGGAVVDSFLTRCELTDNTSAYRGGAASGSTLLDCTLFGNSATNYGGGVNECILYDSTLSGNTASNGGGAFDSILTDCSVSNNVAANNGGGVYSSTLTNCTLTANSAAAAGGGSYGGTLTRGTLTGCTLTGNSAASGGGSYVTTLSFCTLTDNTATADGGGAYQCSLLNCLVSGNSASENGGGAYIIGTNLMLSNCTILANTALTGGGVYAPYASVTDCVITGNTANYGGGSFFGNLTRCTLSGNSAGQYGGGAQNATLNNCVLTGNSAGQYGGGAQNATLNNCVLTGNSAANSGGAVSSSTLNNCTVTGNTSTSSANDASAGTRYGTINNSIVQFNTNTVSGLVANYKQGTFNHTCTTPLPVGSGNFTNTPRFVAGATRLAPSSPCRDTGSNASAPPGTDRDGNPRIVHSYVDMGAYEYQGGNGQSDFDGDGMGNGDEGQAGTDFTDIQDLFEVTLNAAGQFEFKSLIGYTYAYEYLDDLTAVPQVWVLLDENIAGTGSTIPIDDPAPSAPRFYRVRVHPGP